MLTAPGALSAVWCDLHWTISLSCGLGNGYRAKAQACGEDDGEKFLHVANTFRNAGSSFHLRRCEIRGQQELTLCKWYVGRLTLLGDK